MFLDPGGCGGISGMALLAHTLADAPPCFGKYRLVFFMHAFLLLIFYSLSAQAVLVSKDHATADLQAIQNEVRRLETGIKTGRETEATLYSELGRLEIMLKTQASKSSFRRLN